MTQLPLILLALFFVFLNGFFVAAEFAMVKLRHTRVQTIKQTHGLRGRILFQVHTHLDAYLSACQLGITLSSLGLGWIGEPAFAHILTPFLAFIGILSPDLIKIISYVTAFAIISFLHIVVGELMPKSMAIRQSERMSLWTAIPLYSFYWLMYPAIWALNASANALLKWLGWDATHTGEHYHSTDEIKLILHASHLHGELMPEETQILKNTLVFADLRVADIMRPAEELVTLRTDQDFQAALAQAIEHRYSRYPIFDVAAQQITGIVHVKDLLAASQNSNPALASLTRPVLKVAHDLPAIQLLQQFREGFTHLALVYSEQQNLLGFITLDNLLHLMLGRIRDEFHKSRDNWKVKKDGSLLMKGYCSLSALEQALSIELPHDKEIDTLSGLIMQQLGRLPTIGEKISFETFDVVVRKMQKTRILLVQVYPRTSSSSLAQHHEK